MCFDDIQNFDLIVLILSEKVPQAAGSLVQADVGQTEGENCKSKYFINFSKTFLFQVFVGGACEGVLQVGDKIISINDQNAEQISHFEAQHIFK